MPAEVRGKSFVYWQRRILWGATVTYTIYYFCRVNISIAIPLLQHSLGASKTELGFVASCLQISYGAGKFLNAIIEFNYGGSGPELLKSLREIEEALGRPADHPRNRSRTIDIDLLYQGDSRIATADLQLPHPRMHKREFVLQPLIDIRPDLVLPGQTQTARELLQQVRKSALTRYAIDW